MAFFLIAEYQASREETPPVISQNTGTDEPDISDQIMVSRADERPDEEQDDPEIKETEDEDHLAEEKPGEMKGKLILKIRIPRWLTPRHRTLFRRKHQR